MAEKTESPTPKRLREARERGEAARSADLTGGVALVAVALVAGAVAPGAQEVLVSLVTAAVGLAADVSADAARATALPFLDRAVGAAAWVVAPVLLVAMVAGPAATFLQVGPLFAPRAVAPQLERLDPTKGAGRLFSRARLVELVLAVAKLVAIAAVVLGLAEAAVAAVVAVAPTGAAGALGAGGSVAQAVLLRAGVALGAIGVLDLLHQRRTFLHERRMSRDEVRREHREQEGDPHAKQARQRAHREIVEHAVLEDVRRADVLVVNPTHVAVALRYDPEGELDAPEVIARGQDDLARRMIRAAEEAGVPVLREVELARALHELEVGEPVPERFFEAVAVVLQTAWRLREEPGG